MASKEHYQAWLSIALDIAQRGADIALSYFRRPLVVQDKADGTPVTEADQRAEDKMRQLLRQHFPLHGIIGEEMGKHSDSAEYVWTVDPIDGTRSFIRGIPLFGTLLGCLEQGKPVLGVMILPALGDVFFAVKGGGTFCNSEPVRNPSTSQLKSAFISASDRSYFVESKHLELYELLHEKPGTFRGYTDCFGHSLVIRGCIDAMIDPRVSVWDIAPLACLAQEAQLKAFDFEGREDVFSKTFVTSTETLAPELLKLIQEGGGVRS